MYAFPRGKASLLSLSLTYSYSPEHDVTDLNTTEAGSPEACLFQSSTGTQEGWALPLSFPFPVQQPFPPFSLKHLNFVRSPNSHSSRRLSLPFVAAVRAGNPSSAQPLPEPGFYTEPLTQDQGHWTDCNTSVWAQAEPCGPIKLGTGLRNLFSTGDHVSLRSHG